MKDESMIFDQARKIVKNLNGWHRVFIVFVIAWIGVTGYSLWLEFPKDQIFEQRIEAEAQNLIDKELAGIQAIEDPAKKQREFEPLCSKVEIPRSECEQFFKSPNKLSFEMAILETHLRRPLMPAKVAELKANKVQGLKDQQAEVALDHLIRVTVYPFIVYLIGFSVAWIRAGFKQVRKE